MESSTDDQEALENKENVFEEKQGLVKQWLSNIEMPDTETLQKDLCRFYSTTSIEEVWRLLKNKGKTNC